MSRAIDVLVAEKVMGWKWHRCHEKNPEGETVYWFTDHEPPEWWERPTEVESPPPEHRGSVLRVFIGPPPYSTDIAAAWQVVEKMREIACQVDVTSHGEHEVVLAHGVVCYIHGFNEDFWREGMLDADYSAVADTAPMAICLAALRAINVEVPKENA